MGIGKTLALFCYGYIWIHHGHIVLDRYLYTGQHPTILNGDNHLSLSWWSFCPSIFYALSRSCFGHARIILKSEYHVMRSIWDSYRQGITINDWMAHTDSSIYINDEKTMGIFQSRWTNEWIDGKHDMPSGHNIHYDIRCWGNMNYMLKALQVCWSVNFSL